MGIDEIKELAQLENFVIVSKYFIWLGVAVVMALSGTVTKLYLDIKKQAVSKRKELEKKDGVISGLHEKVEEYLQQLIDTTDKVREAIGAITNA